MSFPHNFFQNNPVTRFGRRSTSCYQRLTALQNEHVSRLLLETSVLGCHPSRLTNFSLIWTFGPAKTASFCPLHPKLYFLLRGSDHLLDIQIHSEKRTPYYNMHMYIKKIRIITPSQGHAISCPLSTRAIAIGNRAHGMCLASLPTKEPIQNMCRVPTVPTCLAKHHGIVDCVCSIQSVDREKP